MSSDYIVREYCEGDGPEIVDLLVDVFGKWPSFSIECSKLEHLYWKGLENPLGISHMVLVEHNGEVVAFDQDFVRVTQILGNRLVTGSGVDVAVHPEHRRHGLYGMMRERLMQLRAGNVDCTLANSGNKIIIESAKRRGRKFFPVPIYYFVYIKDPDLHQEKNPGFKFIEKTGYRVLNRLQRRKDVSDYNYDVDEVECFDSSDEVASKWDSSSYDFIQILEKDYLNWRYSDARSGKHRITRIRENGETLGFLVSQINDIQGDYPICVIQEIRAVDSSISAALLEEHLNYAWDSGVNYIKTVMPVSSPYVETFTDSVFVNSHQSIAVWFVRLESESIINQFISGERQNIHLMPGIFDVL